MGKGEDEIPPSTDAPRPSRETTTNPRETRLSLVLAGGSSLAIYMNGVCQELLHIVRATSSLPSQDLTSDVAKSYRDVLGGSAEASDHRVVVDIFSGTSAGGLNALFLAKALAYDLDISALTDLWVAHGDFVRLLNDQSGLTAHTDLDGTTGLTADRPKSLLNGDVMFLRLVEALALLDDASATPSEPLVDAIDCYLTATDLRGQPQTVAIQNRRPEEPADELWLRSRFRFRHGSAATMGTEYDDLSGSKRLVQAFAARATSANPAAFHPAQWRQLTDLLGDDDRADVPTLEDDLDAYIEPSLTGDMAFRWFSDGGDVDNKPFSYALEPLRNRRATLPVSRKVVFVEPDPSRPAPEDYLRLSLPKLHEYTVGAYALGRQETIRQDLEDIRVRNEAVERLTNATQHLFRRTPSQVRAALVQRVRRHAGTLSPEEENALEAPESAIEAAMIGLQERTRGNWLRLTRDELIGSGDSSTFAFEEFRLKTVLQELAGLAKGEWDKTSPVEQTAALTEVDWEINLEAAAAAWAESDSIPTRRFLRTFDVGFRLRRLSFAEHLLSWWQLHHPEDFALARGLRADLNARYLRLRGILESLGERESLRPDGTDVEALTAFLTALEEELTEVLAETSAQSRKVILEAAEGGESIDLRLALAEAWANYDRYDQLLLPVWDVAQGEIGAIEVVRVSPFDATTLVDEAGGGERKKLGGTTLGHFGAFLDEDWRRADILWGRLDAAEVLLGTVLDLPEDRLEPAIERVHLAILEEYVQQPAAPDGPADADGPAAPDLHALLAVNRYQNSPQHQAAAAALTRFVDLDPGGDRPPPSEVAQAFYQLLGESWGVDHRAVDARSAPKADFLVRASRVLGSMLRNQDVDPWAASPGPDKPDHGQANPIFSLLGRVLGGFVEGAMPRTPWAWFASRILPPAVALAGVYAGFRGFTADPLAFGLALLAWLLAMLSTAILAITDRTWPTRVFVVASGIALGAGLIVEFPAALMGAVAPALVLVGAGLTLGLPKLGRYLRSVGQEDL